jgi:hypothetical protein
MAFYQLPRLNDVVRWLPDQPDTVVRFASNGGLILLHATASPALTAKTWLTESLRLALSGTALKRSPVTLEVPPMLSLRLGKGAPMIAPICIFELGEPAHIYDWLNARLMPPELRLLLLRQNPDQPGQATVEASRRIWAPEWATADALLRLRLEQQCLDTDEEEVGWVQYHGRAQALPLMAGFHLERAEFRLDVPGEGLDFSTDPVSERVTTN